MRSWDYDLRANVGPHHLMPRRTYVIAVTDARMFVRRSFIILLIPRRVK
jgi:hypothetical protein